MTRLLHSAACKTQNCLIHWYFALTDKEKKNGGGKVTIVSDVIKKKNHEKTQLNLKYLPTALLYQELTKWVDMRPLG